MVEWNQSEAGIKDRMDFIKDTTNPTELKNTVDNKDKIDNGKEKLESQTSDVKNTTYNPTSNAGTKSYIEGEGERIKNSNIGNNEVKDGVNNHVEKDGSVEQNVDKKSTYNGKVIEGHEQKNADKVGDNLSMKAVEGVSNGMDALKQIGENLSGKKDVENPEAKRFADNNRVVNNDTYTHAQQGDNKLITPTYSGDIINVSELKNTSKEDLARIYNYDKNNNKLSESSKGIVKDELEKRGYDFNSNEYSSKYSPTIIKDSPIIPNGDKHNPGSDIQNTEQINKNKSDFAFNWENTFDKSSQK
jgi:hypothetical protein